MRLADDLDIAQDGKVYFSEATIRYGFDEWVVDALEGRGNGRIIRYDPATGSTRTILRNLLFANGMCMAHDNKSVLFAETWGCRLSRYWLDGPKKGTAEILIPDLPGYPDNINRGSRGTYWVALAGTRTPAYDLAMTMPAFRRRMARRVAGDEWLFPNVNVGCVVHFDEGGRILESLWDLRRQKPSGDHFDARASRLSLSRRRHQQSDRADKLARRRSGMDGSDLLLGRPSMSPLRKAMDRWLGRGEASITMPPMDGAFRPNDLLDSASTVLETPAPDGLAVTSHGVVVSSRRSLLPRRQAGRHAGRVLRRGHQRVGRTAGRRRGHRPDRRQNRFPRRRSMTERHRLRPRDELHHGARTGAGRNAARRQWLGDRTGRPSGSAI